MTVETWESRLAKMDHSKGTSDKMRKAAMKAEIKELRASQAASIIKRAQASALRAQAKTREWRSIATRYQKELAQLRTHLKESNHENDQRADGAQSGLGCVCAGHQGPRAGGAQAGPA